jgi:hypothetical protein
MMASTVAEGTPFVQLAALLQSVLYVPFQDVCPNTGNAAKKIKEKQMIKKCLISNLLEDFDYWF